MRELNEIVTMYLDYATRQARRHIPMTMADWVSKLDAFLQFNDAEILHDKGKVTAAIAKAFADLEIPKYDLPEDVPALTEEETAQLSAEVSEAAEDPQNWQRRIMAVIRS